MNPEIIAINQDPAVIGGDRVRNDTDSGTQVWTKPLADGDVAVLLYNSNDRGEKRSVRVVWSRDLGWSNRSVAVRDLWARSDLGTFNESFSADIGPKDIVFLRAHPI